MGSVGYIWCYGGILSHSRAIPSQWSRRVIVIDHGTGAVTEEGKIFGEGDFATTAAHHWELTAAVFGQFERLPVPVASLVEFPVDVSVDEGRDVLAYRRPIADAVGDNGDRLGQP